MKDGPAPGEVVLDDAWRSFSPSGERGRTLKELVTAAFRRGGPGPQLARTQALAGVTLHVAPGQTVGIVGRNGAGKTSTLRVLAGIIPLERGMAACGGRVATLIELGAGFGREFTGRENIHVNAALHGMSKAETEARLDDIVAFSELGDFIDAPVKTYSSGMLVRLGFAIAAHLDADVMLIDEVLAVGDEAFQRKCLRRISERIADGATLVLVSHAAGAIERACERVVVLDGGQVVFDGATAEGLLFYRRLMGTERDEGTTTRRATPGRAVFVSELELLDGAGRRREVFRPGETLRLVLALDMRAGAPAVRVVLEIRQASGHPVFWTSTEVEPGAGNALLTFEVPRLGLLGGDYDLVVGIHEPGDLDPGIDRLVGFSVAPVEEAKGIADVRGTWTLSTGAVRAGR